MLIVLLVVFIALTVVGGILYTKTDLDWSAWCIGAIGVVMSIFIIIGLIGNIVVLSESMVIDEKIAMFQEENSKIQEEIAVAAEGYKEFESETFKNLKTESPISLVTLFPELKSIEVVGRQIDVYIANNQIIKELKEEKINIKVTKWWVYFGK